MPGISNTLYNRLRQALLECGPFDSDHQLRAVFANDLLAPWGNRLPQTNTITDRVDATISYLMDKRRSDTQMNALVLFLNVLRDRTNPNDTCYEHLADIVQELGGLFDQQNIVKKSTKISSSTGTYKPARNIAFIGYSHKDKKFLQELQVHLAHYIRTEHLDVWDDTKILPGSKWHEEIDKALKFAKVAVLLISADFLASEFTATHELPSILTAAEQEGATILLIILRACAFNDTGLALFQAVNPPSRPLATMARGKRDEIWSKVAKLVWSALDKN